MPLCGPVIASRKIWLQSESVSRSYMTSTFIKSLPETPNSTTDPATLRSNTIPVRQSGQ